MRVIFILFLFSFFSCIAQSEIFFCDDWQQQSDTITDINTGIRLDFSYLSRVSEKCKIRIYVDLGSIYFNKLQLDSSFYYLDKAIALGNKIGAEEELAHAYAEKVPMLVSQNRFAEVPIVLEKSRKLLAKHPKSKGWVSYYDKMGYVSFLKADYYQALSYMDSTVIAYTNIGQTSNLHEIYEHRGVLYQKLSNYKKAAQNFILSLEAKEENGTMRDISSTYQYIASCYIYLKQNKTAKRYLDKALEAAKKNKNDFALLKSYYRLAVFYRKSKNNKKSEKTINKAIVLALKMNDKNHLATFYKEKGKLYHHNYKNYDEAESFFIKAYEIATIVHKKSLTGETLKSLIAVYLDKKNWNKAQVYLDALEALIQKKPTLEDQAYLEKAWSTYYEIKNQPKTALFHLKKYYKIQDSIINKDTYAKMVSLEKEYDTKKKELTISNLHREKEAQALMVSKAKIKQTIFLITAIVLLILLVIGLWVFKRLQRQQKELTEVNQVKNRLFSIIAHDLRGMIIPFQRSGKILKHHIDNGNHERTLALSKALEKNSEGLTTMLDNLLNWSLEQMNGYKMNPEQFLVRTQLKEIADSFEQQAHFKNTTIEVSCPEDIFIHFDKGAFHVIFRNLIGNALKYTENGIIQIVFKKDSDRCCFLVSDTGLGMSRDQLQRVFSLENTMITVGTHGEKGTGLGLNLVYRFVKIHNGHIKVSSENGIGTRFDLDFPAKGFHTRKQIENKESLPI